MLNKSNKVQDELPKSQTMMQMCGQSEVVCVAMNSVGIQTKIPRRVGTKDSWAAVFTISFIVHSIQNVMGRNWLGHTLYHSEKER